MLGNRESLARIVCLGTLIAGGCGRIDYDTVPDAAGIDAAAPDGAGPDAAGNATPVARVAAQAYWTNWFMTTFGTPGMSFTGYQLDATGVVDGELLLIIACIDNGSDTVWPDPLGPGFTQLSQVRWGADGQTCAIDWKIADGEPASYTGVYGPGIVSASALLALVAVTGAAATAPVTRITASTDPSTNPVLAVSPGVDTVAPDSLVLYAAAADWECYEVTTVSFTIPTDFTSLFQSSDRGGGDKDWTAFQIDHLAVRQPGPSGSIASTQTSTSTCVAKPWTAAIAIAPR